MRIRSIKPEFWRSQDISRLHIEDRLLFIGLWSYVDDNGVGEDRVPMIAADLFADDIERDPTETFARVSRGLARLSEGGQIVRFTVADRDYFEVCEWKTHQRIDKPGKSRLPHHDAEGSIIREGSRDPRESLAPGTGNREQGTGDQGTEEQGSDFRSDSHESNAEGTLLSDSWMPSQKHYDHAVSLGLDPEYQLSRFRDHAARNQRRQKNWGTAFTNWLKKGAEMAQQRQASNPQGRPAVQQRQSAVDKARAFAADIGAGWKEVEG